MRIRRVKKESTLLLFPRQPVQNYQLRENRETSALQHDHTTA
jgi:hypothetical protein